MYSIFLRVFTFEIEKEIRLLSEYGILFSIYIFHMKLTGEVYFEICICQWLGAANAFDESSVYYPNLRSYHM